MSKLFDKETFQSIFLTSFDLVIPLCIACTRYMFIYRGTCKYKFYLNNPKIVISLLCMNEHNLTKHFNTHVMWGWVLHVFIRVRFLCTGDSCCSCWFGQRASCNCIELIFILYFDLNIYIIMAMESKQRKSYTGMLSLMKVLHV